LSTILLTILLNGLLREFFPKGYDFASVTDEELANPVRLTLQMPRMGLGSRSFHGRGVALSLTIRQKKKTQPKRPCFPKILFVLL